MVDMVVHRFELKKTVGRLLKLLRVPVERDVAANPETTPALPPPAAETDAGTAP